MPSGIRGIRVLLVTEEWSHKGICNSLDKDEAFSIFFPSYEGPLEVQRAREICDRCPVRMQCEELARALPLTWPGIYSGWSRQDRIRREKRPISKQAPRVLHGEISMRAEAAIRGISWKQVRQERKEAKFNARREGTSDSRILDGKEEESCRQTNS